MQFSAKQIASLINAQIEGDENAAVTGFNNIEAAKQGDLSFLSNPKYEEYLYASEATLIIVNKSLPLRKQVKATLLRVDDAYAAFATLLKIYEDMQAPKFTGIEAQAQVASTAAIGEQVYIGSFAYVGENVSIGTGSKIYPQVFIGVNVKIGENTIIYPGVTLYKDCVVGNNVLIHAGAVIGADGFGFATKPDGTYQKIPQIGNVVIEDDVEIGANTTIDRATINATRIKKGVKIDNLVQLAHNVELGENTAIAAQAGVSGSAKIGRNVMIAGQAGIVGHITLADQTIVTAQSGLTKNTKPKQIMSGSPAIEHGQNNRSFIAYKHLPELEKRIHELEKLVKELSKQ